MFWECGEINKLHYQYAAADVLGEVPVWEEERAKQMTVDLPVRIFIDSSDPDELAGISPDLISTVSQMRQKVMKKYRDQIDGKHQWLIVAAASGKWAKKVFPDDTEDVAVEKPVAPRLLRGIELNHLRGHGLDVHRELQRGKIPLLVDQAEKMPVQVHGVPHHRIIGQDDADILTLPDHDPVRFRQCPAVDAPDVAVHISAQLKMQFLHGNAGGEVRFCEGPQHIVRQRNLSFVFLHVLRMMLSMGTARRHGHHVHATRTGRIHTSGHVMIHVLHAGHGAGAHVHHLHAPAHGHHAVHPLHVLEIIQLGKGTQGLLLPMPQPQ